MCLSKVVQQVALELGFDPKTSVMGRIPPREVIGYPVNRSPWQWGGQSQVVVAGGDGCEVVVCVKHGVVVGEQGIGRLEKGTLIWGRGSLTFRLRGQELSF